MSTFKARIFSYVYMVMVGVCLFSCVVWACSHGYAPFGLRASYSSEGAGMVLSSSAYTIAEGSRGAFYHGDTEGVAVMSVVGSVRRGGELHYFNSRTVPQQVYPARALVGKVVGVVPLLGAWVKALMHPVGVMALIGAPAVMVVLDMLLYLQLVLARRTRLARRTIGGYVSFGSDA